MCKNVKILGSGPISPQNYLEIMTDKIYCFDAYSDIDDDAEFIEKILEREYGRKKVSKFSFADIQNAKDIALLLVECSVWNKQTHEYDKKYFWFETDEALFNKYISKN